MSTSPEIWIGVFSVLIALFGMVIIVSKATNMKPHFDGLKDVLKDLKDAVSSMNDYLKEVRVDDNSHQEQSDRTHKELHLVSTSLGDVDHGIDLIKKSTDKLDNMDLNLKLTLANTRSLLEAK